MPSSSSSATSSTSGDASSEPDTVKELHASSSSEQSDSDSDIEEEPATHDDDAEQSREEAEEDDAPVKSHAEKRRLKRREEKGKAQGGTDDTAPKVKNTAELKPSKLPKRQNSVWVGNLSFKTTPEALRQFFDGVGEITRIHMPMKLASSGPGGRGAVKENRGFAYVDFSSPDAKPIAISLSENHLDGRKLLIKDGDDYSGRPSTSAAGQTGDAGEGPSRPSGMSKTAQKILRSQKQPPAPTLFLGNLGFETTQDSIREMLAAHRTAPPAGDVAEKDGAQPDKWIRKIRMGTFEDSGKCKGWAFVDFTTIEHATAALTNPKNYFLGGRKLVVEYASPEAVRRGGGGPRERTEKKKAVEGDEGAESYSAQRRGERVRPARKRKAEDDVAEEGNAEKPAKKLRISTTDDASKPRKPSGHERTGGWKARARPGAALASAKRETVSIVPSQGKKIVF